MPLTLQEVKNRTATVDVYKEVAHTAFKKGDLVVTYRIQPGYSIAEEAKLADIDTADYEAVAETYVKYIIDNVVSWDLYDAVPSEGGRPIQIDEESVRDLVPGDMLRDIFKAIEQHKRPAGEVNGRSSRRR